MSSKPTANHVTEIDGPVLTPDDGLMIGNGDLSVSVYQTADAIIFRFGKGDVWDRRFDADASPRPVHIDEVKRGLLEEGWQLGDDRKVRATKKQPANPDRLREVCEGGVTAYATRPYPCPKPVGELALHLPTDLTGLGITQHVAIEAGTLHVRCDWDGGLWLVVDAFVASPANALVVRWKRHGWNSETIVSPGRPMVWFSLYRWADPTIQTFAARLGAATGDGGYRRYKSPPCTPLPPPRCGVEGETHFVEQSFLPDPTFPRGFTCRMTPITPNYKAAPLDPGDTGEARLHFRPIDWNKETDWIAVAVTTTRDAGGTEAEARRITGALGGGDAAVASWDAATRVAADAFWSRSSIRCSDELVERTWYETLHARRAAFRPGTVVPALLFPSSLRDYSPWHGDYHTNYNIQSPFWGDYTANHVDDLADAFFDVIDYFIHIGKKIARDYFGCRGAYITLGACPMLAADDYSGTAPMGRMAYMTGWVANHYWWRYQYTLDKKWLGERGYPAIRELALFYLDFLTKGEDGLYHAFPSTQGEDTFPNTPQGWTDRPQVMRHMRYCLRAAIASAEILGVDADLVSGWRDRLQHAAPDNPPTRLDIGHVTPELMLRLPPEFFTNDGMPHPLDNPAHQEVRYTLDPDAPSPWSFKNNTPETAWTWRLWNWYFGKVPWYLMISLRHGLFIPKRDWKLVRELITRWRRPNGLHSAMCSGSFGQVGGWTEQLGIIAPLQEMMLQSWKGYIDLFPAWPGETDVEFTTLRAEGAFLVSAAWQGGAIRKVSITSERGAHCMVREPWPGGTKVRGADGKPITTSRERDLISFDTAPGATYELHA
ncbi:MAG: hypothetical protein K8S99_11275 [Planctomycetes bacterium]|nr:hypothetical protein [Planctomycetota bacterium]